MYYDLTNTVNILQNLDLISIFFIIYLAMKNIFRIECLTHSHLRNTHNTYRLISLKKRIFNFFSNKGVYGFYQLHML